MNVPCQEYRPFYRILDQMDIALNQLPFSIQSSENASAAKTTGPSTPPVNQIPADAKEIKDNLQAPPRSDSVIEISNIHIDPTAQVGAPVDSSFDQEAHNKSTLAGTHDFASPERPQPDLKPRIDISTPEKHQLPLRERIVPPTADQIKVLDTL